jgi:anti-sigma factor RsiW
MDCKEAQESLSAYADAELDATSAMQIAAHVESCAACRGALEQLQELRAQVAQQATRYTAPPHLRQRIQQALAAEARLAQGELATAAPAAAAPPVASAPPIAEIAPPRPPRPAQPARQPGWRWAWINLGLAGLSTTAFAVTLALYLAQPSPADQLEQELVSSHFRALMPDHLADVASTDQHTVKPWFAGKLDYSPPVHDLAAQGYALIGGRLDYVQGRTVAALSYRHKQHIVELYVWPAPAGDAAPSASSRQGFHLLHWRQDGMQYEAISDINPQDLQAFATALRAAES